MDIEKGQALLAELREDALEVYASMKEQDISIDWLADNNQKRIKIAKEEIERSKVRIANDMAMIMRNEKEVEEREALGFLLNSLITEANDELGEKDDD